LRERRETGTVDPSVVVYPSSLEEFSVVSVEGNHTPGVEEDHDPIAISGDMSEGGFKPVFINYDKTRA
jgi:hypothetical protein